MRTILMLTGLLLITPALASHTQPHDTGWYEFVWGEDHDQPLYCNGLGYITVWAGVTTHDGDMVDEALYIHDRPGPGSPYGTGLVSDGGGGTWIFQESNGIEGLQIPLYDVFGTNQCPSPDTVLL